MIDGIVVSASSRLKVASHLQSLSRLSFSPASAPQLVHLYLNLETLKRKHFLLARG